MKLGITQKQTQALSPQMIQSMEILQMGAQELSEYIENVVQENPVLEFAENYEKPNTLNILYHNLEWLETKGVQDVYHHWPGFDINADFSQYCYTMVEPEITLYYHMLSQLRSMELDPQVASCAEVLIECLNQNGWLDEDIFLLARELGQPEQRMKQALGIVQSLEPAGVAARNLSECLCLQLTRQNPTNQLALSIAAYHLNALSKNQYGLIARGLNVSLNDVHQAATLIRTLNPRPASGFASQEQTNYINPDIIVTTFPNHIELQINDHFLPRLNISSYYTRLLEESNEEIVKEYLDEKVRQANWMLSAIEQRRSTVLACVQCILDLQKDFFRKGQGYLVPMSLADVAHRIKMHESTVSRAIRDKYMQCSMGVYPLSHFFVRSLGSATEGNVSSPDAAKALLKKLIAQEDKRKPFSDQKLCEQMADQGCVISRRTVAKYRDELNIPGMSGRKLT